MNTRTSLITITSLTATFVALTAAFFSVSGIAKLFAGSAVSVLVMASALELGKIVGISFLYQYWEKIPKLLKTYLTTASVVLMLITSVGIYGFLSGAYQTTADKISISDSRIQVVQLRKERLEQELTMSQQERDRLSSSIQELTKGLSNNVIQYRDSASGQILTSTSSATRTALQRQLNSATEERTRVSNKIEELSDSISSLDIQIVEARSSDELSAEIGPLRFIAEVTGWEVNKVVNIFALLLVFVFDPLAVALVIAVNFLLKNKDDEDTVEDVVNELTTDVVSKLAVETPVETVVESQEIDDVEVAPTITKPKTVGIDKSVAKQLYDKLSDRQYFTRDGFDWSDREAWENNPIAVEYYNSRIKPYLKA